MNTRQTDAHAALEQPPRFVKNIFGCPLQYQEPFIIFAGMNKELKIENTQVQMRKGILEFCIMHIISNGQAYSSDILKELKDAKIIVVEGTLYPLLTRLKNAGLLDYVWKESSVGPPQKHYKLTEKGESFLEQLNETWIELVEATSIILKRSNIEAYKRLMSVQTEAIKLRS